jgi:hypothetical protein
MICVADAYRKILLRDKIEYAEVQFYFLHFTTHDTDEIPVPYAVVSIYSRPIHSRQFFQCIVGLFVYGSCWSSGYQAV